MRARDSPVDERFGIAYRKEKAVAARDDHLRGPADIGMDKRFSQSHGLDRRQGERLGEAAQRNDIAGRDTRAHILLESRDHDIALDPELARAGLDRLTHLAVAYHQRPCRDTQLAEHGDRVHQLHMVLFRAQHR